MRLVLRHSFWSPIQCPDCGAKYRFSKPTWYLFASPAPIAGWLAFLNVPGAQALFLIAGVWFFYGLFAKLKFVPV
jgi:hypothetical protein